MQGKYEVDISDLIKARKEIKKWQKANVDAFNVVNQRMTKTGKSTALMFDNMGRAMNTTGKSANRLGMQMQQAGYQIGDFAVQVQSGTNVMVALGQQGAQLLGIFGAGGAIAGAALAIGTALIAPLMRVSEEAKEAEDALKKLNETSMSIRGDRLSLVTQFDERKLKAAEKHQATIDKINLLELENAHYAETYGKAKQGTIYANELLIADLEKQLEAESKAYRIAVKRIDAEEEAYNQAKIKAQADKDAVDLANQLKEQILLVKQEKFAALNYDKESMMYQEHQKNIAYGIYERELERLNITGKQKDTLLEGYQHLLDQEQALERINRLNETRMAAEAFIAAHDPRFADETALMSMSLKPSKQSGPKKTKTKASKKDPLQALMEQLQLEKQLLGVNQDRAAVLRALGENRNKYSDEAIQKAIDLTQAIREQNEQYERQQELSDTIQDSMSDAFASMVDGTKTAKEAFRDMARDILKQLFDVLVVQRMVGSFNSTTGEGSGIVGAIMKSFDGGGYTGYGPRSGGLDGKGGFMAMLHPNETVVDHTKGQTGGVVVNQTFNFSANGDESVKKIIASEAPKIANMTQQKLMDSRRRGGSMKQVFS